MLTVHLLTFCAYTVDFILLRFYQALTWNCVFVTESDFVHRGDVNEV